MPETCEAAVPAGINVLVVCGMPATAVHDYGCVHEHVTRKATCDAHAPQPERVGCLRCLHLGHDCPVTFRLAEGGVRHA